MLFSPVDSETKAFYNLVVSSETSDSTLALSTNKQQAVEFMKALSTAHDCMVNQYSLKQGIISYQGPSPDEVTLVEMAQKHGFEMVNQNDSLVEV